MVDALQYVKEQTKEICLEAVKHDIYILDHVKKCYQTAEMCIASTKYLSDNPKLFNDFTVRTPKVCLAAVRKNGLTLQYMKKHYRSNHKLCLEAVKQNPLAIEYVIGANCRNLFRSF